MSNLTADKFVEFFKELHGYKPFPWQERLALRVCAPGANWPRAIALPTSAGKTSCIDIALFALACQVDLGVARTAPRRIFFVIDRRIVVDQTLLHAKKLKDALENASTGVLQTVAAALRKLGDTRRPLDIYGLRGGMYRETAWIRSPLQPTVITATVDQVGSRLLFRGYGVSDSMKPVHAAMIGNDALILLDEAHCSVPFDQTMRYVEQYRLWGAEDKPPFRFVSITATPSGDWSAEEVERDQEEDRLHPVLGPRIAADKPAKLVIAEGAKGKKWEQPLVDELAKQAQAILGADLGTDEKGVSHQVRAIGVIVNRVSTARKVASKLATDAFDVVLLTGRMRPVDRDEVLHRLEPVFSNPKRDLLRPVIVVATQCLEVGADLDFHALISECASLDALRQRFGRLNRVAARPAAKAIVVVRADQTEDTEDDPVYGASLAKTWLWLNSKSDDGHFNFGVAAMRAVTDGIDTGHLNAPFQDAPVLFPAHLDCWVQTHPIPSPDPDPAIFLHGPRTGVPDVQVAFRGDLGKDDSKWTSVVALCPPSSSEALPVPTHVFRRWLADRLVSDNTSDVEGQADSNESPDEVGRPVLRWKGPEKSNLVSDPTDVAPGDTFIISTTEEEATALGDIPATHPTDCGDEAYQKSRDRAILRLPFLVIDPDADDFDDLVTDAIVALEKNDSPPWLKNAVRNLCNPRWRTVVPHPVSGWVVTGRRRLGLSDPEFLEDAESSRSSVRRTVTLIEHSRGVARRAERLAKGCGLDEQTYSTAGLFHDLGKLDPRFQALLQGRSPRTAVGEPLAKSAAFGSADRAVHRYPAGGRHELLSMALMARETNDDLLLHLIATHHGSGRPFADPVEENEAVKAPFTATLFETLFGLESCAQMPGVWNGDLVERFWRIVRKFGWWGAAYREAIFRLADQAQSRYEQKAGSLEDECEDVVPRLHNERTPLTHNAIALLGVNGSNPLGFLCALGTLAASSQAFGGDVRMSWVRANHWLPVMHVSDVTNGTEFVDRLTSCLHREAEKHPATIALNLSAAENARFDLIRVAKESTGCITSNWITALFAEFAGPDAASQLLLVRKDYLRGNIKSILMRTTLDHIKRSLLETWDYRDPVDNQSLHWEPSEDRRHAYQWDQPSGDPSRKTRGGMLGANRLAFEAWPMFFSIARNEKLATRGFRGNRANSTFLTWPIWRYPLSVDSVASLLALPCLQESEMDPVTGSALGLCAAFRSQRILVGKTPNLTPAVAVM